MASWDREELVKGEHVEGEQTERGRGNSTSAQQRFTKHSIRFSRGYLDKEVFQPKGIYRFIEERDIHTSSNSILHSSSHSIKCFHILLCIRVLEHSSAVVAGPVIPTLHRKTKV